MLVPIPWAIILALLGIAFGYFLAPIPITVIAILGICCLIFLFYAGRNSIAEGGIAVVFCIIIILLFLIPMVAVAGGIYLSSHWQTIKDSAAPVTNFNWSWLFRQR